MTDATRQPHLAGDARQWLTAQRRDAERDRDRWRIIEARWSWARLLVFVAAAATWFFFASALLVPVSASVCAALLFGWAVKRHLHARDRRELLDCTLLMCDEALRRCGGAVCLIRSADRPAATAHAALNLSSLLDSGRTWALSDQEREDLDLYAQPVGVFGLLNRTSTAGGARRLRDMLDNPCLDAQRIRVRQAAVRWLQDRPAERTRLMAAAARSRTENERLQRFAAAVYDSTPLELFAPTLVLRLWSLITAAATLLATGQIMVGNFTWVWLLAAALGANALILRKARKPLAEALARWHDVAWGARALLIAARQGAADLPDETDLAVLRARFADVITPGALPRIGRRAGWVEHGGVVHMIANGAVLFDLHVAEGVLKPAVAHRVRVLDAYAALGELEALCSLACFAYEQPCVCYPTPVEGPCVRIADGCHPLIRPERVVPNEVRLDADTRVWVVTGSNMAGKSTLLRMTGVNLLLAQVGGAVAAREMTFSPLRLITDLRARDSLAESESYFLAEVRHLKRMVLPEDDAAPLLGLIDEPFRGTNSLDQSAASVAVLRYLLKTPNLFLLATHDRHLTEVENGPAVRNVHFRENLSPSGMVFDYRVHEGPARTRNALRVLEHEGYPPSVLSDANAWLSEAPEARGE